MPGTRTLRRYVVEPEHDVNEPGFSIRDTFTDALVRRNLSMHAAAVTACNLNVGAPQELAETKSMVYFLLEAHLVLGSADCWSIAPGENGVSVIRSDGQVIASCLDQRSADRLIGLAHELESVSVLA